MSQELTCETCGAALDAEASLCLHCGAPGPAVAAGGDEVYRETGFRAQALPVAAGDMLSGRFRLLRALGRGGMGVVWLASDEELDGQHVALKVLRPEIAVDSGGVADMKREVIITRALRHPNIVAVYDHHTDGARDFITMAYVDGPSLADALTARDRKPYTLEEVLPWARQVAEALDYAHGRGVLHRDVKPGNILLAQDGTAHLTDFGIARMARDTLSRRTGHTASGTLAYMSPQQLLDEKAHRNDPRNDVYAFAATLYELLSGEPPFTSGGIEAQIALKQPDPIENVPDYVNDAVLQGLAKEVDQRPENCAALMHVLSGDAAREAAALREQEEARRREDEERQREEQARQRAEAERRDRERRARETEEALRRKEAEEETRKGEDVRMPLFLSPKEARDGCTKAVTVRRREVCRVCHGKGRIPEAHCNDCGGKGVVRRTQGFFTVSKPCETCSGKGRLPQRVCERCSGNGRGTFERTLEVKVPAGTRHGNGLRLREAGHVGEDGSPKGDVFLSLRIQAANDKSQRTHAANKKAGPAQHQSFSTMAVMCGVATLVVFFGEGHIINSLYYKILPVLRDNTLGVAVCGIALSILLLIVGLRYLLRKPK